MSGLVSFPYRERIILRHFVGGLTVPEIASELELSVATIHLHLRNSQRRAGLRHRGEIPLYLYQNPGVLAKHGKGARGLHSPAEDCPCPHCRLMRRDPLILNERAS